MFGLDEKNKKSANYLLYVKGPRPGARGQVQTLPSAEN